MSKLVHSNQETMDEIERRSEIEPYWSRRSEIEGDYIASIEGPHEDKSPVHPSLEELNKCIAINEAFKARKNVDVIINPDRATDIELYCLYAVRDGAKGKPPIEELAKFLCEKLADEPFDELSRSKYLGDAKAILKFLEHPTQSPWMDIETAPKDGSRILIALTEGLVLEASWEACWINHWSGDPIVRTWKGDSEPVSWMPLPAPPTHNSPPEERQCQKCGCATEGEEAWVDGKIWCHPCADETSHNHGEDKS